MRICRRPKGDPLLPRLRCGTLAAGLVLAAPSAFGANWFTSAGLTGDVTVTDNSNFGTSSTREDDVLFSLTPSITLRGEGGRLRIAGTAALSGVTYLNGSQDSSFNPVGSFTANLEAIERWFYIDAALNATRSLDNPLAPRPDGISSFNRQTTTTARLSPYLQRELPNDLQLLIRSDNAWTDTRGGVDAASSQYAARHFLRFQREPRPLGWALEAEQRQDDRADLGTSSTVYIELARARLRYAFSGTFALGVRAGAERSDLFENGKSASFAGAELSWRPTERTRLEGFWEKRSFGDAWEASFTHRAPFVAWDLRSSRDLTTFDQAALELPATGDLAGLLDAALRTRIVDPIERARAVEDFIAQRGLPRSLSGPINVFSDQVVIRTSRNGTVTFIGSRSTLALTGYYQRDQTPSGDAFTALTGPEENLTQYGGSLAYSLRLTSLASTVASISWSRTRSEVGAATIATAVSGESRQRSFRLQYDYQLAPKTTGFVGGRYQIFNSDVINDSRETAFFAGLGHRF